MLPEPRAQILVVDDELNLRRVLGAVLERAGYDVLAAGDGNEGLAVLANHHIDVVVTDLRMPGVDGMALLREAQRVDPDIPVILLTAYSTVDNAVEALKSGAFDYLTKPFEQSDVLSIVRKAVQSRRLAERETHRSSVVNVWEGSTVVGTSPAATHLMHSLEEAARRESHVLLVGERGTGKELLARALHRVSMRQRAPFVKFHCETQSGEGAAWELFGVERVDANASRPGKISLAAGGVLFVEEVARLAAPVQLQLAQLMHMKPAPPVRVIGSVHGYADEPRMVAELVAGFETVLRVPPLRERLEDIPALCRYFVARYSERLSKAIDDVSVEVFEALSRYHWPGNLRELENVVEQAVLFCDSGTLGVQSLPSLGASEMLSHPETPHTDEWRHSDVSVPGDTNVGLKEQVREAMSRLERDLIHRALLQTHGNVTHAARLLKISRKGLQLKMKELGLRERE
jgi:two-component system, NtrC family, response regulator AtoC